VTRGDAKEDSYYILSFSHGELRPAVAVTAVVEEVNIVVTSQPS